MYVVVCPRIRFSRLVITILLAVLALSVSGAAASAQSTGCEVGEPVVLGGSGEVSRILVSFTNASGSTLTFKEVKGLEGEFIDLSPPCKIAVNETVGISSTPNEFLHGTEFALVYELANHSTMRMTYRDPFFEDNSHSEFAPPGYAFHTTFNEEGSEANFTVRFSQGCECDGIPDEWKEKGVTIDPTTGKAVPSGTPGGKFIDLPQMGVSLDRPTVMVQMDWMEDSEHNQKLEQPAIDKVIEAFDRDPVTYPGVNGTGSGASRPGITLIVDNGPESTITPGGKSWGELSSAKAIPWEGTLLTGPRSAINSENFEKLVKKNLVPSGRKPIFHYAVAAAKLSAESGCTSGFTPHGGTKEGFGFIVSLGGERKAGEPCWENEVGAPNQQTGTFMHELGHALGLHHGGEDAVNLKPNYPSVMNYLFQFSGVLRNEERAFDYSREPEEALQEKTLTEIGGFGSFGANPLKYGISWICPIAGEPTKSTSRLAEVDWNCDNPEKIEAGEGFIVNGKGGREAEGKEGEAEILRELKGTATSDWGRIDFLTGAVGTGTAGESDVFPVIEATNEITPDIAARMRTQPSISYTGALSGHYHDPVTASATLVDPTTKNSPVAGASIAFKLGSSSSDACTASTNSSGVASCTIAPTQEASTPNIVASFAGDSNYQPASDTQLFTITPEETTVSYTGPTAILAGGAGVTLTANMAEDGSADNDGDGGSRPPVPSENVSLSLGGQSCNASTDTAGNARCTIPAVTAPLGPETVGASFAGDRYYAPSSATKTAIAFTFPSRGAFTLGDQTVASASATTPVTWWADNWSSLNSVSAGPAPSALKGFAANIRLPTTTPAAQCASSWTTTGGDSSPPPSTVPSYMGTVVTSAVTKSGATISGNPVKIVVVKTNPGYVPNPGHHGTGTIIATYC